MAILLSILCFGALVLMTECIAAAPPDNHKTTCAEIASVCWEKHKNGINVYYSSACDRVKALDAAIVCITQESYNRTGYHHTCPTQLGAILLDIMQYKDECPYVIGSYLGSCTPEAQKCVKNHGAEIGKMVKDLKLAEDVLGELGRVKRFWKRVRSSSSTGFHGSTSHRMLFLTNLSSTTYEAKMTHEGSTIQATWSTTWGTTRSTETKPPGTTAKKNPDSTIYATWTSKETMSPNTTTAETSTPEMSTPEMSTPEMSTPEMSTQEPSTPETSTPETSSSAIIIDPFKSSSTGIFGRTTTHFPVHHTTAESLSTTSYEPATTTELATTTYQPVVTTETFTTTYRPTTTSEPTWHGHHHSTSTSKTTTKFWHRHPTSESTTQEPTGSWHTHPRTRTETTTVVPTTIPYQTSTSEVGKSTTYLPMHTSTSSGTETPLPTVRTPRPWTSARSTSVSSTPESTSPTQEGTVTPTPESTLEPTVTPPGTSTREQMTSTPGPTTLEQTVTPPRTSTREETTTTPGQTTLEQTTFMSTVESEIPHRTSTPTVGTTLTSTPVTWVSWTSTSSEISNVSTISSSEPPSSPIPVTPSATASPTTVTPSPASPIPQQPSGSTISSTSPAPHTTNSPTPTSTSMIQSSSTATSSREPHSTTKTTTKKIDPCARGFYKPSYYSMTDECACKSFAEMDTCLSVTTTTDCTQLAQAMLLGIYQLLNEEEKKCNLVTAKNDVNECVAMNGGCQHRCTNTPGSYVCGCDEGFGLNEDQLSCDKLPTTPAPTTTQTPTTTPSLLRPETASPEPHMTASKIGLFVGVGVGSMFVTIAVFLAVCGFMGRLGRLQRCFRSDPDKEKNTKDIPPSEIAPGAPHIHQNGTRTAKDKPASNPPKTSAENDYQTPVIKELNPSDVYCNLRSESEIVWKSSETISSESSKESDYDHIWGTGRTGQESRDEDTGSEKANHGYEALVDSGDDSSDAGYYTQPKMHNNLEALNHAFVTVIDTGAGDDPDYSVPVVANGYAKGVANGNAKVVADGGSGHPIVFGDAKRVKKARKESHA